jgi:hypothetical protein
MRKFFVIALSLMMFLLSFAPAAVWAESASGSDATKQFEALKEKGILEGYADGSAGLDREMTRAEFSAVLVRLLELNRLTGTPSYMDTSGHWAHEQGYIEAVTERKLMEGTGERIFDPEGKVTLEQLAAIMVRGLGLHPVSEPQVQGKTSDWAKGYVAAAVQEKLIGDHPDYTQAAKREVMVGTLFAAHEKLKLISATESGPVSILEFKAAGAKKLSVKLNRPVDTDKVTFEVKRENAVVEGKASFSENRQSAVIVFDSPLKEGTYSVELKGVKAENAGQIKAETAVEKERLEKIEFITASDTLPRAKGVYVEFHALNQYGETSTWNANQFDIHTGNVDFIAVNGKQAIKLQLQDAEKNSIVAVNILHPESGLSAHKTFTVGDRPLVSKIEVGDLLYSGTDKKLYIGVAGYLKIRALDQYGIPVTAIDETGKDQSKYGLNTSGGIHVVPQNSSVLMLDDEPWIDYDGDDFPELKIIGGKNVDQARESEITLYALGSGQSVTKKIQISAIKVPYSLQFGNFNSTIAVGDKDVILPLIVKDDQGAVLSSNELAENIDQLVVTSTLGGAADVKLEATGKTKGLLAVTGLGKGSGTVTVQLKGTDKKASLSISVQEERYPAKIFVKTDLAPYYIQEAEESFVIMVKDQYGEFIRNASNEYVSTLADPSDATKVRADAAYKIHATYENIGDPSENGALYPSSGPLKTAIDALRVNTPQSGKQYVVDETFTQPSAGNLKGLNIGNLYNTKMTFKADSQKTGKYRITLKLVKLEDQNGQTVVKELDKVTKTIEVIDGLSSDITYKVQLNNSVNNTIFAAVDAYRNGVVFEPTVTANAYGIVKDRYQLAKEVLLTATNRFGQEVEVPVVWLHSALGSISSSNPSVASAVYMDTGTPTAPYYRYYVIGDQEGSAILTAIFKTRNGSQPAFIELKTSEQLPEIVKTSVGKAYAGIEHTKITGKKMWDYALMGEVVLTDQYGSTYKNDAIATCAKVLNLNFYVTDIVYKTPAGDDTVTVNPSTGVVTYTGDGDIASFTLVIMAPNGKKVQTVVNLK